MVVFFRDIVNCSLRTAPDINHTLQTFLANLNR